MGSGHEKDPQEESFQKEENVEEKEKTIPVQDPHQRKTQKEKKDKNRQKSQDQNRLRQGPLLPKVREIRQRSLREEEEGRLCEKTCSWKEKKNKIC